MNIWKKWIIKWGASIQETWEIKKIYVLKNAVTLMLFVLWFYFSFKLIEKLLVEQKNKNINSKSTADASKWHKNLLISTHFVPVPQVYWGSWG